MSGRLLQCALLLALLATVPVAASPDEPLLVALAIDTSGSLRPGDLAERERVACGIAATLPPGSRVAVLAFDVEPRVVLEPTSDPAAVSAVVADLGRSGRYTALHDAVLDGIRLLDARAERRQALLLITDGRDENSAIRFEDAADAARRSGVPVFAAGIGRVDRAALRRLTKLTGGDYFPPGSALTGIAQRLEELTPARPQPEQRATPAPPPAPAPVAAAGPDASLPLSRPLLVGALLLLAVMALGSALTVALVLLRRSEDRVGSGASGDRRRRPRRPAAGDDVGEGESNTLVTRFEVPDEPHGSTLILQLRPLLHVTRGVAQGKLFEVSPEVATSVGRAEGNDIVLPDQTISHQHCRIRPGRDGYEVIDLDSTNGTYINERRIERHPLVAGDVIRMGETRLQFRMDHMMAE